MKTYGLEDVQTHVFLTLALVGGEWMASRSGHFTPGERVPGTYWIGGLVGTKASIDNVENRKILTLLELRPLSCPAHSQSLLHYLSSCSAQKQNAK
jgi:hypothetical protein